MLQKIPAGCNLDWNYLRISNYLRLGSDSNIIQGPVPSFSWKYLGNYEKSHL
jgi:hypothetical protein